MLSMRVLLVGGAGYIGSHVAVVLAELGHEILIIDSLRSSSREALRRLETITGTRIPTLIADVRDEGAAEDFLRAHGGVDAIVHLAGLKSVGESVSDPIEYYDVNIGSTIAILRLMKWASIRTLVFSGSATVYGAIDGPASENVHTDLDLANPYGKSKRIIEELLRDTASADDGLRLVSLRYFNPVGAHPSGLIGEDPHETPNNLMPIVSRAAFGVIPAVTIHGDDYDTPDGTGLRDYIHVMDLAAGHAVALERASRGFDVFNLGTGVPVSVRELIAAFARTSGREVPVVVGPRRPGDVAVSFADPAKARDNWGWSTRRTIDDACRDYWEWQTRNPHGYSA